MIFEISRHASEMLKQLYRMRQISNSVMSLEDERQRHAWLEDSDDKSFTAASDQDRAQTSRKEEESIPSGQYETVLKM